MLWGVATTAFIVDRVVDPLDVLRRGAETLSRTNILQLVDWNYGADVGIIGLVEKFVLEIGTATIGRHLPFIVQFTILVVLCGYILKQISLEQGTKHDLPAL